MRANVRRRFEYHLANLRELAEEGTPAMNHQHYDVGFIGEMPAHFIVNRMDLDVNSMVKLHTATDGLDSEAEGMLQEYVALRVELLRTEATSAVEQFEQDLEAGRMPSKHAEHAISICRRAHLDVDELAGRMLEKHEVLCMVTRRASAEAAVQRYLDANKDTDLLPLILSALKLLKQHDQAHMDLVEKAGVTLTESTG